MGYHQDFINSIYKSAVESSNTYKIPSNIILAQACQESGWGQKTLGNTNNIFNIKADSSWTGKYETHKVPEYINGKVVYEDAKFRAYDSVGDSIKDHAKFLSENPRYHKLFDNGMVSDTKAAQILQKSGYATDPNYAENLQNVINGKTFKRTVSEAEKLLKAQELKNNNQTSNQLLPKEAILLADSGQIKSDVFFNYVEEEKPEKISARLIFLENDIKNQTYGVIDGSYNISHIRGESGINNPYSYYVDFISDEKIVLSDILNIDAKIKLKERFI